MKKLIVVILAVMMVSGVILIITAAGWSEGYNTPSAGDPGGALVTTNLQDATGVPLSHKQEPAANHMMMVCEEEVTTYQTKTAGTCRPDDRLGLEEQGFEAPGHPRSGESATPSKPQVITEDEIQSLPFPRSQQQEPPSLPGDMLVREDGFCPSIARDENDVALYVAVLQDDGTYPHRYIRIMKSTDHGWSWFPWWGFYSNTVDYNLPSICVLQNQVVVVYMYGTTGIHAFHIEKDTTPRWFETIDTGANLGHPSVYAHNPHSRRCIANYRDYGNDQVKYSYYLEGEDWSTAVVIDSGGDLEMKYDGSNCFTYRSGESLEYVTYFRHGTLYVARDGQVVLQVNLDHDIKWPAIRANRDGSVLVYAMYYNNSPLTDLLFAFSYDYGDPGTWSAYYWDDPNYDQFWPNIGIMEYESSWFHVGYWDKWPDGTARVWALRAPGSDLYNGWQMRQASVEPEAPPLADAGKVAVVGQRSDTCAYVLWEDDRSGGDYDTYSYWRGSFLGVEEEGAAVAIPSLASLSQNHPNPFNVSTVINYQLPANTHVKLQVYNTLGRKVATLVDSKQQAGYRSVSWHASEAASGIYSYKLTAGEYTEIKRMTLLK